MKTFLSGGNLCIKNIYCRRIQSPEHTTHWFQVQTRSKLPTPFIVSKEIVGLCICFALPIRTTNHTPRPKLLSNEQINSWSKLCDITNVINISSARAALRPTACAPHCHVGIMNLFD